jgi:hypothetical protein
MVAESSKETLPTNESITEFPEVIEIHSNCVPHS